MIHRIGSFLKKSLGARKQRTKAPTLHDLHGIRAALLSCIKDCEDMQAKRLHLKINAAASAQDLWLLRNDAYQAVAADRINQLLATFDGWVDPRQLAKIR
jgi:hypothetical protein